MSEYARGDKGLSHTEIRLIGEAYLRCWSGNDSRVRGLKRSLKRLPIPFQGGLNTGGGCRKAGIEGHRDQVVASQDLSQLPAPEF